MRNANGLQFVAAVALGASAFARPSELASVSSNGSQGDDSSLLGSISGDGRWVAFTSLANNLAPGTNNFLWDVFARDRLTGTTMLVSRRTSGVPASGGSSYRPDISRDGRFVAFESRATNLVPGDTNNRQDIFVHDLTTGQTTCVSRGPLGVLGDGDCEYARISADGRFVMFTSAATNLVEGDTNGKKDVFVFDRASGSMTRASVDSAGLQSPRECSGAGFSSDGRYALFLVGHGAFGSPLTGYALFARDLVAETTIRVSPETFEGLSFGHVEGGEISDDGRYVAYLAPRLVVTPGLAAWTDQVFLTNLVTGETTFVSRGMAPEQTNYDCWNVWLSGDGDWVTYSTFSPHVVEGTTPNGTNILTWSRQTGSTTIGSVGDVGTVDDWYAAGGRMSADGRFLCVHTGSEMFAEGDANGEIDVLVIDRGAASACPGDTNGDGVVNFTDLNAILTAYNSVDGDPGYNPGADIDADSDVDFADLNVVVSAFNTNC